MDTTTYEQFELQSDVVQARSVPFLKTNTVINNTAW